MPRESNPPSRITVYATPFCGDTRRARRILDEMAVPYEFIDFRQDETAARYVEQINNGFRSSPTIVFPDGDILVEPADRVLREKLEQLQTAGYDLQGGAA